MPKDGSPAPNLLDMDNIDLPEQFPSIFLSVLTTGCSLKTGPLSLDNNSSSFHPSLASKLLNERYCNVPLAQLKTFIVKRLKMDEI